MKEFVNNIRRVWMKLRLQPIRVFCLHHVTAQMDAERMIPCDWTERAQFKSAIHSMQQDGVEFISLTDAYSHIANDKWRNRKYAVLTFDDGYTSLKEILPWLEELHIPVTLFINGKYLDGMSYRKNPKEQYLTKDELFALTSTLIEIGSHGWEHTDATQMTDEDFVESLQHNIHLLSQHPRYIPFHAFTYGRHDPAKDVCLMNMQQIPVLIDGGLNYNNPLVIHRELLPNE